MLKFFIDQKLNDAEVFYCSDYFSGIDDELFNLIDKEVKWTIFPVIIAGKTFNQPRESAYIADDNRPYKYSGIDRIPDLWTPTLSLLRDNLNRMLKQISPNHTPLNAVLCNRYSDGKHNIGFHSDNETDLEKESFIVSVSLGATRDFIFKSKTTDEKVSIPLVSGSVVLMGKDCQKNYNHSIPKRMKIKTPRINLTFRSVIKRK